jgi:hypothetical protein
MIIKFFKKYIYFFLSYSAKRLPVEVVICAMSVYLNCSAENKLHYNFFESNMENGRERLVQMKRNLFSSYPSKLQIIPWLKSESSLVLLAPRQDKAIKS